MKRERKQTVRENLGFWNGPANYDPITRTYCWQGIRITERQRHAYMDADGNTTALGHKAIAEYEEAESFRLMKIDKSEKANTQLIKAAPALLKALKAVIGMGYNDTPAVWSMANDAVAKATENQTVSKPSKKGKKKSTQKWTAVKDKLPKIGERVLTWRAIESEKADFMISYFTGKPQHPFHPCEFDYWMPLPSPPKAC